MRILWRIITGCFKWTWRLLNLVRECILNVFVFILFLAGIGILLEMQPQYTNSTQGALLVNLNGIIVDQPATDNALQKWGRELLGASDHRSQENSLFELVDIIRQAKTDKNITGMVLSLKDFTGADQPSLQYIGKTLREFRDSGKPIYAIGDSYNQEQYYLASFANKIYLSPQGMVFLNGFSSNHIYYKSLLEKLKVTTHIFRVGTYKSAVEPFIRNDMSPEAKAMDQRWINSLWANYLNVIAANRQLATEQIFPDVKVILTNLQAAGGDAAKYALDNKLVDQLALRPEIESDMIKVFGWNDQKKDFNYISIYDYSLNETPAQDQQIAVIFVNGAIIDGSKIPDIVSADTMAAQIRQARLDPKIKALILRVNSPGGSVTASEVIRAELAAVHSAGKPIVVSMGGVAASGGYWIATPAHFIIASPSTLTGSIGIFNVVNTFENSLKSIGVYTDGVATSPLAELSVTKPIPDQVSQIIQMTTEKGYENFIDLVASARKKTPEQINEIAQGQVWTGTDAKNNGLIDQLGDFDNAVEKAAALAQLKTWELNWYTDQASWSDMLFNEIQVSAYALLPNLIQAWLPAPLSVAKAAIKAQSALFTNNTHDVQHSYALCLSCAYLH